MAGLRFGVVLLPYSVSFERVLAAARRAEELGFSSVWVPDHLQRGSTPILECWTTISALAAACSKIRLGSLATCNSFRNPALLAKMVATVSNVSGGRVDVGIGVGYDDSEHTAYGYSFPDLADRVSALSESLRIMTALWRGAEFDFRGKHFALDHAVSLPRPVGRPRVWVAGRSDPVLEAAASCRVYGVNILPYSGTRDKRRISSTEELAKLAQKIASRGLRSSLYCGDGGVVIAPTGRGLSDRVAQAARFNRCTRSEMEVRLRNLSAVYGTVDQCETKVKALESSGFEELMLIFPGWQVGDYSGMSEFARAFVN